MAIHIHSSDLWDFFCHNREKLSENYLLLAENQAESLEVYLTEEGGFPYFTVEINGEREYEEDSFSREDAERIYQEILGLFLPIVSSPSEKRENSDEFFDEDDLDRLEEINSAADSFLSAMLEISPDEAELSNSDIDAFISMVEEYLYETHGLQVRHPSLVYMGDGNEPVIIQYPFGDED